MPPKRKKTVSDSNLDYHIGVKGAKLRSSDGKFKADPLDKILGKKKKKR